MPREEVEKKGRRGGGEKRRGERGGKREREGETEEGGGVVAFGSHQFDALRG